MRPEKDIMEIGKEKLQQLKTVFDELEVQLALGKAEAKEVFEREKKNLNQFVNEQKIRFKKEQKVAEDKWDELLARFESLEASLSAETATDKALYDAQKEKTLRSIYELEHTMKEAYGDLGATFREQLDAFKARLDSYRIQLALSEFDNAAEAENRRNELKEKVNEIRERMQKEEEEANKVDDFVSEMSTSFDHLKKAFSDLFAN
ncbi:MAG: hypothetical protein IPJ74_08810 [Saprospiraceae bacterium]|nr:hypothetical protein [Saprospiraceae bacterium]